MKWSTSQQLLYFFCYFENDSLTKKPFTTNVNYFVKFFIPDYTKHLNNILKTSKKIKKKKSKNVGHF